MHHSVRCLLSAGILAGSAVPAMALTPFSVGGNTLMFNSNMNSTTGGFQYFNGYGSRSNVADNGSRVDVDIGSTSGGDLLPVSWAVLSWNFPV